MDFTASSAVIFDDVRPELASVDSEDITCGDTEIDVEFSENVMCESVDPTDFTLSGPGGPYTILDAQGETCLLGAGPAAGSQARDGRYPGGGGMNPQEIEELSEAGARGVHGAVQNRCGDCPAEAEVDGDLS